MIAKTYQQLFLNGANELASTDKAYGPVQQAAGFTREQWELLTDLTNWTLAQQRQIAGLLSEAVSICMRLAGLPPTPLPGAFVAAVIVKLVAPCNRLIGAVSAPASFDCMSALGLMQNVEIVTTTKEQMMALVVYFSAHDTDALTSVKVDAAAEEQAIKDQVDA